MKNQIKAALVAGAGAAAIAAALSGAGSANASCASLNGHDIGDGCESSEGQVPNLAIGIGPGAVARSFGSGNVAISIGGPGPNNEEAYGQQPTQTLARGVGNFSLAVGNGTNAGTKGKGNVAIALGNGSNAYSFGGHPVNKNEPSKFNTSVVLGNAGNAYAIGPKGPKSQHAFQVGSGTDLEQDN